MCEVGVEDVVVDVMVAEDAAVDAVVVEEVVFPETGLRSALSTLGSEMRNLHDAHSSV